jgi:hypothetical protein
MIDTIEKDVTDDPDLRVAKDYLALLIGLSATLGHVKFSFTASNRPDFSVLTDWFNDQLVVSKQRVKDLEAAAAAVSPSHGPAPSPSAASPSPGPGRDFGAIFEDMLVELEKEEYDSGDEDLREAREQVTLLAGLEATLDRLVKTSGGPQGDMRQLRTGLADMRAEMEAEATRLAPAGGGGSATTAESRARLVQAVTDAEAAIKTATAASTTARDSGIAGDDYAPFKQAVAAAKRRKKAAEAALAMFDNSFSP